jgi:L-amino acid N-acyltransferase YncA
MTPATVRPAAPSDAEPIAAIYAPIVRDTAISFEVDPPSAEAMRRRIAEVTLRYPWLVCDRAGEVLGYAYAGQHRARAAYRWSVDVSVYVLDSSRRRGVGRALYGALFRILVLQGYFNAYAGITLPNAGSVGLHEAMGFTPVGVYGAVGFKLGAWHDVGWWQLELRRRSAPANPPLELASIIDSEQWRQALSPAPTGPC